MSEKLPTEVEICELPWWAQVAYVARCARRVLPLFQYHSPDAPPEDAQWVTSAVAIAEADAAAGKETEYRKRVGFYFALKWGRAFPPKPSCLFDNRVTETAATAVAYADAPRAADAVELAAKAGAPITALLQDFRTLRDRARKERWTDRTPVPPTVFGPMWPDGPPPGWPLDPVADVLRLRIAIPDDATEDDVKQMVRELTGSLTDVHRAAGGSGLQVDSFRLFDTADVPAGVPQ